MSMITDYTTEVPAPPLVRRSRGLLVDALLPIPVSGDRPTDPGGRDYDPNDRVWAGVNFCSLGCSGVDTWADRTCVEVGEEIEVPEGDGPDVEGASFGSFIVSAGETSPVNYDPAWISSRIGSRLTAQHSAALAYELLTGAQSGNPSLQSSATHVVATAAAATDALFVLEDILATFDDLRFFIHMDPGTFTVLNHENTFKRDDGPNYITSTGHTVIADAGHDGTLGPVDPDDPEGAAITTDADGRWIYASLPVMGLVGPELALGGETGRLDMTRDTRRDIHARQALLAFDPCAVVAVQVEVPTYSVDTAGS